MHSYFYKILAGLVSLTFLPKALIWNKITFPALNALNLAELLKNKLIKSISQENTYARVFFLIKLQVSACNFAKKETLAQMFPCEFYKFSKNTFSYRTPPVAASVYRSLI